MDVVLNFKDNMWISVKDRLPLHDYDWVLVSVVDLRNPRLRFVPRVAERHKGKWASQDEDGAILRIGFM